MHNQGDIVSTNRCPYTHVNSIRNKKNIIINKFDFGKRNFSNKQR